MTVREAEAGHRSRSICAEVSDIHLKRDSPPPPHSPLGRWRNGLKTQPQLSNETGEVQPHLFSELPCFLWFRLFCQILEIKERGKICFSSCALYLSRFLWPVRCWYQKVSCGDRQTEEVESSHILSDWKDPAREFYSITSIVRTHWYHLSRGTGMPGLLWKIHLPTIFLSLLFS